jgi:hypothetical protein
LLSSQPLSELPFPAAHLKAVFAVANRASVLPVTGEVMVTVGAFREVRDVAMAMVVWRAR